jgi:hypothetical protein
MFDRNFFDKYKNEINTQVASLTSLPFWYPFFARSLYERTQILKSETPGNLAHSSFFTNKTNYYRGISANLFLQPLFPYSQWLLTTLLAKIENMYQRHPTLTEKALSAFITGASSVAIANPYEITVIAAQQHQISPFRAFLTVLKQSGIKGFYTGAIPMAVRNGVFVSGLFVTSPELQRRFSQFLPGNEKQNYLASTILGSLIPATIFTCVAVPLDLVVAMRQADPSGKLHASAMSAMKSAYKMHGLRALKAGALMRLLASTVELTVFNMVNNMLSQTPAPTKKLVYNALKP